MNAIYRAIGITKQGFHQWLNNHMRGIEEAQQLLPIIRQVRKDHPAMSAKVMYGLIRPSTMGRDRFEQFCFSNGFRVHKKVAYHRTTNSLGVTRFDNLILNLELKDVNQVWVSDITYYRISDRFYYLTFIMDLFSRLIVGYSASTNLMTDGTTIPALKMALKDRKPSPGLIIHSDGGGQYYSKEFLAITRYHKMLNSMCDSVYENPHAERVNGTIKNSYLYAYNPRNDGELHIMLRKAVHMYNIQKPHESLSGFSPYSFEKLQTEMRAY